MDILGHILSLDHVARILIGHAIDGNTQAASERWLGSDDISISLMIPTILHRKLHLFQRNTTKR